MINNKTILQSNKQVTQWYLIDAKKYILGKMSTKISNLLTGKNKIDYNPNTINNIYIIVINSKEIQITGKKREQKIYTRHSGQPGGLKQEKFNELQQRQPNKIIQQAVKGMLPKNKIGKKMLTRLKIYATETHPYLDKNNHFINL
uniref:Ribosomal protein L13 n=1 Tax=Crouania attenuata TaxID=42002 RepID=A0A4D6WP71_9FLOR|nr:ribosomal protein L13 [Crouania attenuata]